MADNYYITINGEKICVSGRSIRRMSPNEAARTHAG